MAAAPSSSATVAAVLRDDDAGYPRALGLLAALIEAEARRFAAAASLPAETDLVRSFRGGAAPTVGIAYFLQKLQRVFRLDACCYVLAGVYLTRLIRSRAAREAGLLVEPATAHRLAAMALLLGAKFANPGYFSNAARAVEVGSCGLIRAREIGEMEIPFLCAVGYRLFVSDEEFRRFCGHLERGPREESKGAGGSCGDVRKRKGDGGEEEDRRRVRACLPPPPPVVKSH